MKQSARKIYRVTLTEHEQQLLEQLVHKGHSSARIITRHEYYSLPITVKQIRKFMKHSVLLTVLQVISGSGLR